MRIGNVEKGNQIQCKPRGLKARRFSGYVPGLVPYGLIPYGLVPYGLVCA